MPRLTYAYSVGKLMPSVAAASVALRNVVVGMGMRRNRRNQYILIIIIKIDCGGSEF
jgi:hypothetical protein